MKNNEIIATTTLDIAITNFKNPKLTAATKKLTAIYNDATKYAEAKNREIARILGDVSEGKLYVDDGFKSVADYAHDVFGIAKQNAYALATAGKVYNDPQANPELKAMTPSKIAEISKLDNAVITKAIEAGRINANSTQKELREFASEEVAKNAKPEVLERYTASPCVTIYTERDHDTWQQPKTIDEWDEYFQQMAVQAAPDHMVEVLKLPNGRVSDDSKKATVTRRLYVSKSYSLVVEFYKYTAPKPSTKKPKFTREELEAMLADLQEESTNK